MRRGSRAALSACQTVNSRVVPRRGHFDENLALGALRKKELIVDLKQPVTFALWAFGIFVFAIVARIGWEIGGRLLAVL